MEPNPTQGTTKPEIPVEEKSKKQVMREALLKELIRRKQEVKLDAQLEKLMEKHEQFKKGISHNRFGCACLGANMLEKAQEHLLQAEKLVNKYLQFSNVYMNLGNLYAQKRLYKKAADYYEQTISTSPFTKEQPCDEEFLQIRYSPKINSYGAYVDAHTNLAVMCVNTDEYQKGFEYCKKSIELSPDNPESQINFGDILRQVGRKDEAIDHTWKQIEKYTQRQGNDKYERSKWVQINPTEKKIDSEGEKFVNILTVKWGKRYGADYVNKLYAGIARNTSWKFKFYCFTDDGTDLHESIVVMPLEEGWTGWWGKVTLFKDYPEIQGKKFYIDLDMIVTGNIDSIFSYSGTFGTLKTDDLACEKQHKGGYNSSIMMWHGGSMLPVYQALRNNFENIKKFIVRFDFWLEMNIRNADFLQDLFQGEISDYLQECQKEVPKNTRIVCFPRKPKPDEYPAEWIKERWVL